MADLIYSPCPKCRNGMEVNPHKKTQDSPCSLCYGTTVVGEKCICGRPARMDQLGYVKCGKYYCGRKECREKILEELEPKRKGEEDEDLEYYRRMCESPYGMGGWL